jgi:hypothetical protein
MNQASAMFYGWGENSLQLPSCAYDRICSFFETIHLSSCKARDLLCSRFDFFVKEQGFEDKCPPKYQLSVYPQLCMLVFVVRLH